VYATCLFCNESLGRNPVIEGCPVGRILAFDPARGRLWVVCHHCARWNLTPLDERWEAIDDCERRFRATALRYATDNIGLAAVDDVVELVRIGPALRPEVAAWRYGRVLRRRRNVLAAAGESLVRSGALLVRRGVSIVAPHAPPIYQDDEPVVRMRLYRHRTRVVDATSDEQGRRVIVRCGHLDDAVLLRPEPGTPWRLRVRHDGGIAILSGDRALHSAAKVLSALNAHGGSASDVRAASRRLDEAENPEGYFSRIVALAMRTRWGRAPHSPEAEVRSAATSLSERLALHVTNRSFWARGGIGSEPETMLLRVPLIDRLALEMAANEDAERRALDGRLAELKEAWREAEEIAAIADGMFDPPALESMRAGLALRHAEGS
jgi:hypothetical protein